MLRLPALFAALVCVAQLSAQQPATDSARSRKPDPGPLRTIEFDVDEGTWTSLDVARDGRSIVFDLLGDLYTLPIGGGDAKVLLGGRDWDHMPRFSPDGSRLAFISDRDGNMNVWIANADGSNLKQLTKERTNQMRSPLWTPDGLYVIAHKTGRDGGFFMYHRDGGTGFKIGNANGAGPALSPDGRFLYYSAGGIQRLDRSTGDTIRLTHGMGGGVRPVVSPNGRYLAYGRQHDATTALHLRDLQTGAERVLVPRITPRASGNQDELPGYAFTPDGNSIVITIDGKLHRIDVASGRDQLIPLKVHVKQEVVQRLDVPRRVDDGDLTTRVIRWTSLSPDGKKLVFSALGKLYVTDVGPTPLKAAASGAQPAAPLANNARRLSNSTDREYTPTFSPDGRWIAYTTWSDAELGSLRLISADGKEQRKLTTLPGRYTNPSWSADGSKIVFVRGSGVEMRGGLSDDEPFLDIVWIPVTGGEPKYVTSTRYTFGFALRYYPVVSFNPDASRIFFTERSAPLPSGDQRTAFASVRLDGTDKRVHMRFVPVEEVVPSPDLKHVAFARRENIVVAAMPDFTTTPIELSFESGAVPVKKLTREGGTYVQWKDANTLQWSFANKYYRQRLDQDKPELVHEVNLAVPRAKPAGVIAFTNARIVSMKGDEVIEDGTIVVRGNRIEAVGPASTIRPPEGATVVSARGQTIVPGLIDVHAHMHYASMEFHPQQKWEYLAQLAYGVTTTFDPSAHNQDVFPQYEMVESGEMIGPRVFSTGDVIYGDERVFPVVYEPISSLEDARNVVKRFKAYDPIMLKEYMQPRRDQRQWLAQAARENNVAITAEGGADLAMDLTLVLDGYTAFEHSLPIELHDDVVQLVARAGTHYTPTLVVAYGGPSVELYFWNKGNYHDDAKLRRFVPESEVDAWRRHQRIPEEEWHFLTIAKGAAAIHKAGGNVTLGAHGQLQGLGTLWELWGLAMGGLTPLEAIRQGTYTAAVKLGLERDLGSVEPGKLADFIVINGNPAADLNDLLKARYVVKNGFVYDAESLTRVWPDFQPLAKFFWMSEEDAKKFAAPAAAPIRR
jgi:Tol biopolymer transport system component/imidazolonepropionase-like amidohydrolase